MDLSWGYISLRKYNYLSSSAYNVFEYSLSPFVLHIIMCMKIHCAKKERIWQNTGGNDDFYSTTNDIIDS